jgi:hypothetical protein
MTYAETHNYCKVRRAHDSVPLCIEPPPHAFLDPFFGRCGKTSRRDILRVLQDRAASFANEREVLGETRAPMADCKMQPNTKALRSASRQSIDWDKRWVMSLQDGVIASIQVTILVVSQLCGFIE